MSVLAGRQRQAGGDADLPFHEIDARHRLGDRMLHLQAGVHLEEIGLVVARLHDELDRAGTAVADRPAKPQGAVVELVANLLREVRRRRLLEDLLVVALDRAVALEQVHQVAVARRP